MATIFVSHSARDEVGNRVFQKAFSTESAKAHYLEFDIYTPPPGPEIEQRIKGANAVFVVLGPNAVQLPHTRTWISWEVGVASGVGREIWVFEPYPPGYDLPVPKLNHYMVFGDDLTSLQYIRSIIKSYDDSAVLPAALAGGTAGAALGRTLEAERNTEKAGAGLFWGGTAGALAGILLASRGAALQRPPGITIRCPNFTTRHGIRSVQQGV